MTTNIDLDVEVSATVLVTVSEDAPDDIFTRAETSEFQDSLYGDSVADRGSVLKHWSYNAILNRVDDASRLDGWGDLDRGMVSFIVYDGAVDEVFES